MRAPILLFALCVASATSFAAENVTALSAIKKLPKGDAQRIARIEAREGDPNPERWYILVHDPAEENGLREYVVAEGEVVAKRALSQFAEGLKPDEVVGTDAIRFDSDRAAKLAQSYAAANNVTPATINYQLRKDEADGTAVWNVTCIDQSGRAVGGLVLAANKGTVLSRTGFAIEPATASGDKKTRSRGEEEDERNARKRYVVRQRAPQPVRQAPPEKPNFLQRLFGR